MVFLAMSVYAESYGEIGLSSVTRVPFAAPAVFPTEVTLASAFSTYSFPTDTLAFFLDIEAAAGLSMAGGAVDLWFSESTIAADGSLALGSTLLRLGTDTYVYSETTGSSFVSVEPFASVTGGSAAVSWRGEVSVPVSLGSIDGEEAADLVEAWVAMEAGLSLAPLPSLIIEPFVRFETPDIPGGSLRVTWLGSKTATFDIYASYSYAASAPAPHELTWLPSVSVFAGILGGTDVTVFAPGSAALDSSGAASVFDVRPTVTAGLALGASSRFELDLGAVFASDDEPYGSVTASLTYSF
jgi:hypothetical protein